ncbi:hypothetical protein SDC9_186658 [bioreactor metagenome]|uniref:Uncharacterized protein n=1 Tax=bioreactor metagenome TaxID=1076179 RepID=A0A645HK48_9ZZZZ
MCQDEFPISVEGQTHLAGAGFESTEAVAAEIFFIGRIDADHGHNSFHEKCAHRVMDAEWGDERFIRCASSA